MKISELPKKARKLAKKNQKDPRIGFNATTDNLIEAFSWSCSREGFKYWKKRHFKSKKIWILELEVKFTKV